MTVPMVQYGTVFDAIAATETKALQNAGPLGQVHVARSIFLEINGGSTPDWTLDIQGRVSGDATWHNIDYFRVDQGVAVQLSVAQLAVNWSTARHYVIPTPPPFVRLVATRTGGTLTVYAAFSSEAYSLGAPTTGNAYGSVATVTRAANQTAYDINDTVGGAFDLGVMGPTGGRILIQSSMLEPRIAAVPSGMGNFRVALYSVTPTSAVADNGAWTRAVADNAEYLCTIDLGTPVDLGAYLGVNRQNIGQAVLLSGTHLFAYLITDAAFTPAANSEVYALTLITVAL